jgi:hypothetical protein
MRSKLGELYQSCEPIINSIPKIGQRVTAISFMSSFVKETFAFFFADLLVASLSKILKCSLPPITCHSLLAILN